MQPAVGYFYYSVNINWAAQNPRLGRIMACGCGLDIGGLEIGLCVCLAIAGVANQSETKSHISYCVTAKCHIMYIVHGHT